MSLIKDLLFATMGANSEKEKGDFTGEKYEDTVREPVKPAGGASSWNDLTDKPFYKETKMVGGDTLTWDGNTEGLVSVDLGGMTMFCIADTIPTMEDFANGATFVDGGDSYTVTSEETMNVSGLVVLGEGAIVVCPSDNLAVDALGATFPAKGVYFAKYGDSFVSSLTIPGYTGFVSEQTVVTPIPTEYLPEHLQFGETTVEGDTLTWDGNKDGRVGVADMIYKISDNVLTLDDVQNGATVTDSAKSSTTYSADEIREFSDTYGIVCFGGVYVIPSANFELQGMVFPEAGIYVMAADSASAYTESITIPGYTGFTSTTVKPLDEKYMPILTSPGGKKFKISVDDSGVISAVEV